MKGRVFKSSLQFANKETRAVKIWLPEGLWCNGMVVDFDDDCVSVQKDDGFVVVSYSNILMLEVIPKGGSPSDTRGH